MISASISLYPTDKDTCLSTEYVGSRGLHLKDQATPPRSSRFLTLNPMSDEAPVQQTEWKKAFFVGCFYFKENNFTFALKHFLAILTQYDEVLPEDLKLDLMETCEQCKKEIINCKEILRAGMAHFKVKNFTAAFELFSTGLNQYRSALPKRGINKLTEARKQCKQNIECDKMIKQGFSNYENGKYDKAFYLFSSILKKYSGILMVSEKKNLMKKYNQCKELVNS